MSNYELLSTCWTTAGNVMPTRTGPASPERFEHRVRAAADAGYVGFGIGHADIVEVKNRLGYDQARTILTEHGMRYLELEYLDDWWLDGARRTASDIVRADLFDAAEALGASHIKAGTGQRSDAIHPEAFRAAFAELCESAAAHGTRIALEPAAFSALPTISPAIELVTDVNHPAGGLLVDIWHIFRSGQPYEELAAELPGDKIFAVEINDGRQEVVGSLFDDTFDNRLQCGQGEFALPTFVRLIARLGYKGPWGVEIMSHRHRSLHIAQAAREAHGAAVQILESSLGRR